jgi:hypothetical protein
MELWLSRSPFHEFFFFTMELWLSQSPFHEFFFFMMELWLSRSPFHEFFPFHDGTLAIKEPFTRTFHFFTMEFWLSRSLSHELSIFHDGILAIKEPFTRNFSFSRWNSGYQGGFHTNFFFFTMEFWLSRSLSHELFLFHDGILAIKEPFTRTFSFSRWNSQNARFRGRLFSYVYITKSIYIGSASLKTLPLDLEPLCKEKSMVLLILMRLRKGNLLFFSRNH